MTREEVLKVYEEALAMAELERKGKTMPYTSSNGHMFSFINKDDEMGIRLSKTDTAAFDAKYGTKPFISHGATMREYVLIPQSLLSDTKVLSDYLQKGFNHVMTLPPK